MSSGLDMKLNCTATDFAQIVRAKSDVIVRKRQEAWLPLAAAFLYPICCAIGTSATNLPKTKTCTS